MEKKIEMHDGTPQMLSLDNLASGAAYELGNEALKRMAANIADVNTSATQKRKVVLTIEAVPYKDRSGAQLSVRAETKLAGMEAAEGTMFISRRGGEYVAFVRDQRQVELEFEMRAAESPDVVKPS